MNRVFQMVLALVVAGVAMTEQPRAIFADLNIHARVHWAKGGSNSLDLFMPEELEMPVCASAYGLCE